MSDSIHTAPKTVAIVSGKGGSGKTMIATAFAQGIATQSKKVLLVDADLGTGGLTYYLGFDLFDRGRSGFADYLNASGELPYITKPRAEALAKDEFLNFIRLLPVGEHRFLNRSVSMIERGTIESLIEKLEDKFHVVIFDCRGGIDEESLTICAAVDEVVIVVET